MAAEIVVAYHAADEAVVRRGNPVVAVDVQLRQGADVDAELVLGRNRGRQAGIQPVDALQHDHVVRADMHHVAAPLARAGVEVEVGQFQPLAGVQPGQLIVDQLQVERLDVLEVRLAVFILGRLGAAHEVVVQGNRLGIHAAGFELQGEPLGEGRLARRRRPGNQDPLHLAAPLDDLLGQQGDALLLIGFVHVDEIVNFFLRDTFIEVADRAHPDDAAPVLVALEHVVDVVGRIEGRKARGIHAVRAHHDKALLVGDQLAVAQGPGVARQRLVRQVHVSPAAVDAHLGTVLVAQQIELVRRLGRLEVCNGLVVGDLDPVDRRLFGEQAAQAPLQVRQLFGGDARLLAEAEAAIESLRKRVFNGEIAAGIKFVGHLGQQKRDGMAVHPLPV